MKPRVRCAWSETDPLLQRYHDEEWGVVERDSRRLWEALMLDAFQAGLSWLTILRKRDGFREAFAGFDPQAVARFDARDVARLMNDAAIVRARAKIEATIGNAKAYLAMQGAGEDFSTFAWGLAGGKPLRVAHRQVPSQTPLSDQISKALKARGFKFTGPVAVYAWMQATGIVNDHAEGCFRRNAV